MQGNKSTYITITRKEFLEEFEPMRRALRNHVDDVVETVGVDDYDRQLFNNVKAGRIDNPIILASTLNACKVVYNRLLKQYSIKGI